MDACPIMQTMQYVNCIVIYCIELLQCHTNTGVALWTRRRVVLFYFFKFNSVIITIRCLQKSINKYRLRKVRFFHSTIVREQRESNDFEYYYYDVTTTVLNKLNAIIYTGYEMKFAKGTNTLEDVIKSSNEFNVTSRCIQ